MMEGLQTMDRTEFIGEKVVRIYRIHGTRLGVADVHEPGEFGEGGSHVNIDKRWYRRIGTNPDRSKYEHLPARSDERMRACEAAYQEKHKEAVALIRQAFPELFVEVPAKEVEYGMVEFDWPAWVAYQERAGEQQQDSPVCREVADVA